MSPTIAPTVVQDAKFVLREACPACGREGKRVYSVRFDEDPMRHFMLGTYGKDPAAFGGAAYDLRECTGCGTLYQAEVGNADFLEELYTHWLEDPERPEEEQTYANAMRYPLESRDAHEIVTAARFLAKAPRELEVLDYGMGWSLWASMAKALGCHAWGSDLSSARMAFAESKGIRVVGEGQIPSGRFDFINTEQVFEHLTDPLALATRLATALAPGGILKISVPSAESFDVGRLPHFLATVDSGGIMPVFPLQHINGFTHEGVRSLAARVGLSPVKPSLSTRYAFLLKRRAVSVRRPRNTAKELVRPIAQWRMFSNLYYWFRKPL